MRVDIYECSLDTDERIFIGNFDLDAVVAENEAGFDGAQDEIAAFREEIAVAIADLEANGTASISGGQGFYHEYVVAPEVAHTP